MLLELGRLRASVVSAPFSVGEDGYEDGKLAASSDSHDSLEEDKQFFKQTKVLRQNYKEDKSTRASVLLRACQHVIEDRKSAGCIKI